MLHNCVIELLFRVRLHEVSVRCPCLVGSSTGGVHRSAQWLKALSQRLNDDGFLQGHSVNWHNNHSA